MLFSTLQELRLISNVPIQETVVLKQTSEFDQLHRALATNTLGVQKQLRTARQRQKIGPRLHLDFLLRFVAQPALGRV